MFFYLILKFLWYVCYIVGSKILEYVKFDKIYRKVFSKLIFYIEIYVLGFLYIYEQQILQCSMYSRSKNKSKGTSLLFCHQGIIKENEIDQENITSLNGS